MSHATEGSASELAFASFLKSYPTYTDTAALDGLRAREYDRLDRSRHIYLDYTGGSLYGASQIREYTRLLEGNVFGNPHSANPTSQIGRAHV